SYFRFRDYNNAENNFSGNQLTGVPQHVAVSGLVLQFPRALQLSTQYTFTDRVPLNDANTAFAKQYHLLQAKIRWINSLNDKFQLELFTGADNILNQRYSLGNDINAFGSRFYNAAPLRNYYGGLTLTFL
ncbi:MAG: TonB-dependent receptor, partial [Cytophagales bacterium CG18_big_fil_WC_8_21_14_2_50_42_9]